MAWRSSTRATCFSGLDAGEEGLLVGMEVGALAGDNETTSSRRAAAHVFRRRRLDRAHRPPARSPAHGQRPAASDRRSPFGARYVAAGDLLEPARARAHHSRNRVEKRV